MTKNRLVGLDLFRIYAAFAVFLFHSHTQFYCDYKILNSFVTMGAIFMTAFFVLSGFVLYYVYGQQTFLTGKDYAKFYFKRLSDIIPIYYIQGVIHFFLFPKPSVLDEIKLLPVELFGIQNWFSSLFRYSHNGGSWFISCILFCYFLYPLLAQFPRFINDKGLIILEIILGFILLYSPFVEHFFRVNWIYENIFLRATEFMLGVILCEQFIRNKNLSKNKRCDILSNPLVIIFEIIIHILLVTIAYKKGISPGNYMLYSWISLPLFMCMIYGLAGADYLKPNKMVLFLSEITLAWYIAQDYCFTIGIKIVDYFNFNCNIFRIILCITVCFILSLALHYIVIIPGKKIFIIFSRKIIK